MKKCVPARLTAFTLIAGLCSVSFADIVATETIQLTPACAAGHRLVVLPGVKTPALIGSPIDSLSLYKKSVTGFTPIAYQVDPKDKEGRYILGSGFGNSISSNPRTLDENDELVFLAADAGQRLTEPADFITKHQLIEFELVDPASGRSGWIYVMMTGDEPEKSASSFIHYNSGEDVVEADLYRIGFSPDIPFLIDALYWRQTPAEAWSADITDTMKIRHRGKLFGLFPFQRTGADYSSRLVGVKTGPLRIIRRTENKVRVLLGLKTPSLYVDYVMAPNGFVMDTMIDIPFKVGLFFSEVDTLTTIDWRNAPNLPELYIESPANDTALTINGAMSAEKHALNQSNATHFFVYNRLGGMHVNLEIPDNFPIKPWLYLHDAQEEADPPEREVGQFGNIGFRTTGWEDIDTKLHHLKYNVCMTSGKHPDALSEKQETGTKH